MFECVYLKLEVLTLVHDSRQGWKGGIFVLLQFVRELHHGFELGVGPAQEDGEVHQAQVVPVF